VNHIRNQYESLGVDAFYKKEASTYRNPHEQAIKVALRASIVKWRPKLFSVLDLACGSGEITANLPGLANVVGTDPYTSDAYYKRIGKPALQYSFDDISNGCLQPYKFDLVVCSYAMHLLEPSKLHNLLTALAQITDNLLVISPNKRPYIDDMAHGFKLEGSLYIERVRVRYFSSLLSSSLYPN
jgi:SAM-dependent methyltransferase